MRFHVLLTCILTLFLTSAAQAEELDVHTAFASQGDHILCLTSFVIPEGYHAYAHSETGGMPASLVFALEGNARTDILYPAGVYEKDPFEPNKKILVYKGPTQLLVILPKTAAGKIYGGKLNMLLCSDKRCLPIKKNLGGTIPKEPQAFEQAGWHIPELENQLKNFSSTLELESGSAPPPVAQKQLEQTEPPEDGNKIIKAQNNDKPLVAPEDFELHLEPVYFSDSLEVFSLWKALLLGIAAGLLLNAMPCVLPVLALKINSLLVTGGGENMSALKAFRRHNLFFMAGVMTFFTLLAILLGAADMLWGQLFQSQLLVLLILYLVFLMGLSMFGIFTLPILDLRMGVNSKNPAFQSFSSGLLCTFLATPCSGPLLGGVLAWAFSQPLPFLVAVFWSVGLGMCLPYFCFCVWPNLGKILPRPGNWMYVFEHILGFLLLGTTLYLLTILPERKMPHILCTLLALAFFAWIWGRFCTLVASFWTRMAGSILGLGLVILSVVWIMQPMPSETEWLAFDAESFIKDHGKKNLLVEFTADWCPNCKYLEATVLTRELLAELKKAHDLEFIKVDLTNSNPYAEKLLTMLGSRSIPVTAIFGKGENSRQPIVLRDLYGGETLKNALREIF